ncbi:hypothetical protein V1515DRAFT_563994 [Lipomyces mesembrius]
MLPKSRSASTTSDSDTATRRNSKKARVDSNSKSRSRSSTPTISEWPEYFRKLEATHRAINTVYTFLSARKHIAPLFQTLKTAVEAQAKRELTLEDIAAIKFLLPNNVRFEYVDENDLKVYEERVATGGSMLGKDAANDIFKINNSNDIENSRQLLVFEFVEEDLKKSVSKLQSDEVKRKPKGRDLIKMPTYSTANMTKLISKRNKRFAEATNKFMASCTATGLCPEMVILSELDSSVPKEPTQLRNTPERDLKNVPYPPLVPRDRRPIPEIVDDLTMEEGYQGQIVENGALVFPAQAARFGDLEFLISQELADALYTANNVTQFYSHQVLALNDINDGKHVIVATSTSSGKSLIYQVPILRALEHDRDSTAIYMFPTKALAQDQKRALQNILRLIPNLCDIVVDTYDGDTPKEERKRIREEASIIFTNPDMLHVTILPSFYHWRSFFRNLKYVVVDELHVYNGLFGSHVAFIMRRLRRLCGSVGNNSVQFISCSATIANPREHMSKVFGVNDIEVIDDDGSPAGEKHFLVWNCPYKDRNEPALGRKDAISEATQMLVKLICNGVRTIAFCRVRTMCELLMKAVRQELVSIQREEMIDRVMSYRGGYTAQDRRRIEKDMFEGQLLGIVATNALELGVDIGSLDAVLIVGFPFSIANLRQQSGRAGRRNKDSLTVLVGDAHPIDQYFMQNPNELFEQPYADVLLDLENLLVLESHLQCAAYELPISIETDEKLFGHSMRDLVLSRLVKEPMKSVSSPELYTCHPRFLPMPSRCVSIRDIDEDTYAVVDITNGRNIVVEEIEATRTSFTVYEGMPSPSLSDCGVLIEELGAIHIHQGRPYIVRDFNPDTKIAKIERTNVDWTTSQRDFVDVDAVEIHAMKPITPSSGEVSNTQDHPLQYAYFGNIKVTMVVFGYFKRDAKGRIIDAVDVTTTPPVILHTKGFWVDVPDRALALLRDRKLHLAGAIHAAQHMIIAMTSSIVMSSGCDIRTECKAPEKEFASRETARKRPARLTFYDARSAGAAPASQRVSEWGSGMSRKVFEFLEVVLRKAIGRIESCRCAYGCPECVAATNCKESSIVLSKVGAFVILKAIMDEDIDPDLIPEGPEGNLPQSKKFVETIVPVEGIVKLANDAEIISVRQLSTNKDDVFTVKVESGNQSTYPILVE